MRVPTSALKTNQEPNNLRLVVKATEGRLLVSSVQIQMQMATKEAENNKIMKKLHTATLDGAQIVKGEDGQSMFDQQNSSKRNLTDNASGNGS